MRRNCAGPPGSVWECLGEIAGIQRRPEHLARALEVAADAKVSDLEREAAIAFLVEYWRGEEPDGATVSLLEKLEREPANRRMLVGVLQTQIALGLRDPLEAMFRTEDWDDAHEGMD